MFSSTLASALFGLLLLGASTSSARADCETIDLNRDTELKNMPVLDQDGAGLCYAFVASQLIDFKLRSAGTKFSSSPIDIALLDKTKNRFWKEGSVWGGFVEEAIDAVSNYGVASSSCVKNEMREFTKDTGLSPEQLILVLEKLYRNKSIFLTENEERGNTLEALSLSGTVKTCDAEKGLDRIFEKGLWPASVSQALTKILYKCAQVRLKIQDLKYKFTDTGSNSLMRSKVDEILVKKVPAAVALCSEVLKTTDSLLHSLKGESPPFIRGQTKNKNVCSSHTTMAVGRMKIAGKCHYLIRNSWGATWHGNGHTCACKTRSGAYYADCSTLKKPTAHLKKTNREAWAKATADYTSRIYVGCWIETENLAANLTSVGALQ